MLGSFKRLFAKPGIDRDLTEMQQWALDRGHGFKRARGDDGFVIDGAFDDKPWRIEWGPPQRAYIAGRELRLRMELDLPSALQMLVLSRPLMDSLERQTFEEFTDNVQTHVGTKTPEEMRWLVMFPKVDMAAFKPLRERFAAVASAPASGLAWIEGPLADALEQATHGLLRERPPFVLMTLRGRAYLRMQLAVPDPARVAAALAVFEIAVAQALRASVGIKGRNTDWGPMNTTAWQSIQPVGAPAPRKRR